MNIHCPEKENCKKVQVSWFSIHNTKHLPAYGKTMSQLSNPKEYEFLTWPFFFGRAKGVREIRKQNMEDNQVESVHHEPADESKPKSVFLPGRQSVGNKPSSFGLSFAHGETSVVSSGFSDRIASSATGSAPLMISQ